MMSSNASGADLQRVESYQWPSGHVGHLSADHVRQLEAFKQLCKEKGYYQPANEAADSLPTHDDETLLRYLRARKFVPQEAFVQFKDTEDWRKENDLDSLYQTIDIAEYDATRRLYPQWTGRRDKRGIPFYVFEVAALNPKDVSAHANEKDKSKGGPTTASKEPPRMLRLFALYESMCRFVLPLCSAVPNRPNAETPVSQSSNIVDISKVGLTTFWNLKAHMQDASKLATAHYPETLDRIFIIGAPSFFPTVWSWIKRWFDPITVSKIFILSQKELLPTLEKYLDKENIPKKYGGSLDWSFGDMPALDADLAKTVNWKEEILQRGQRTLPTGPIRWQYSGSHDLEAVAVGTENGTQRKKLLGLVHQDPNSTRLSIRPGLKTSLTQSTISPVPNSSADAASTTPAIAAATTTEATPVPDVKSPAETTTTAAAATPSTVIAGGTADIPYHHPDTRQGTSDTRYEQQTGTHAEAQLAHGTPAVRRDGQGVEHSIMEPRTVGQAPKHTPLVDEPVEKPSVVEQVQEAVGVAQGYVTSGAAAVLGAVGLGGGASGDQKEGQEVGGAGKKAEEEEAVKKDHPVDGMKDHQVEEFMRSETMSGPEKVGGLTQTGGGAAK